MDIERLLTIVLSLATMLVWLNNVRLLHERNKTTKDLRLMILSSLLIALLYAQSAYESILGYASIPLHYFFTTAVLFHGISVGAVGYSRNELARHIVSTINEESSRVVEAIRQQQPATSKADDAGET